MENPNREETNLRVFNTAKVFAELILFPLMFDYKKFQRQANYGSDKLNDSLELTEELRDIQRFNGLKAMSETCYDLLTSISSTVKLKGNKEEITKLKDLVVKTEEIKLVFYNHKERFFNTEHKNMQIIEVLNRIYFDNIRKIIDICYINTEILMTRNKLLFADTNDEYMTDEEMKEMIKKEYIDG